MGGLRWVLLVVMTQKEERKLIEYRREKNDSEREQRKGLKE